MALRADRIRGELQAYIEGKLPAGSAAVMIVQLPGDDDLILVSSEDNKEDIAAGLMAVAVKLLPDDSAN